MQVRLLVLGASVAVLGASPLSAQPLSAQPLSAQPLSAQSDAAPTSQRLPRRGAWMLSAGVDPLSGAGDRNRPGPAFQAGYERRLGASRFGLRVEGTYWRQTDRTTGSIPATADVPPSSPQALVRTRSIGGGSLLGTYQLRDQSARVRPYLLAGAGVHFLTQRNVLEAVGGPGAGTGSAETLSISRTNRFSPSVTGGVGLAWRVGRASLFAEGRTMYLSRGIMDGHPSIQGIVFPLTLGLRF